MFDRMSHKQNNGEKVLRYSIRKYNFGVASVAVAALMFFANGTVQVQAKEMTTDTTNVTVETLDKTGNSGGEGNC